METLMKIIFPCTIFLMPKVYKLQFLNTLNFKNKPTMTPKGCFKDVGLRCFMERIFCKNQ